MHDVGDRMVLDDAQRRSLVAQVHFLENIFRMPGNRFQIFQPPGVGETIQIDELRDLRVVNDVMDEVGADEAGAASNEEFHFNNKGTK